MGRGSKLSPALTKAIADDLANSADYPGTVAQLHGIDKSVHCRWMQWGEKATSGKYYNYYIAIQNALSVQERYLVGLVREAAKVSWPAAMTLLERTRPEKFSRMEKREIKQEGTLSILVDMEEEKFLQAYVDTDRILEERSRLQLPEPGGNGDEEDNV